MHIAFPPKQIDAAAAPHESMGSPVMLVSNIESSTDSDSCELRATIDINSLKEPFRLWYRFSAEQKDFVDTENGDPFVAVALLPAMRLGEPLQVEAPVSQRLLDSTRILQSVYHDWDRTLSEVPVRLLLYVMQRLAPWTPVPMSGSSSLWGSIPSIFLLLKNLTTHSTDEDRITHLILLTDMISTMASGIPQFSDTWPTNGTQVAKMLDKKVVHVATNLREFSDRFVDWGRLYHGAALASFGLALEPEFKTIYMAGGHQPRHLHPWGLLPCTLCGPLKVYVLSPRVAKPGRVEKIRFLAQFPIAMETLRVCFNNPNNEYNCGKCEKCVRTRILLAHSRSTREVQDLSSRHRYRRCSESSVNLGGKSLRPRPDCIISRPRISIWPWGQPFDTHCQEYHCATKALPTGTRRLNRNSARLRLATWASFQQMTNVS